MAGAGLGQQRHAHAVGGLQPVQQTGLGRAGRQAPFKGQALGRVVQLGDVVVPGEEEVAHLLVGHGRLRRRARAVVAQVLRQRLQPLARLAPPLVQGEQRTRHGGHVGGQLADLGERHRIARAGGGHIGHHVAQAGDQARLVVVGKALHVHAEHGVDLEQHGHGERALVLLDLVQVAGRQVERARQRHLGHAALLAQAAQAHAHEGFSSLSLADLSQYSQNPGEKFTTIRQFRPYAGSYCA